jgi:glutamine amidotransferase
MIRVVNLPFCNFYSLERYLRVRSHAYQILGESDFLSASDTILLPGVGTFSQGMDYLAITGLGPMIQEHACAGGRVVGICLGMQMLLEASSESPGVNGLGLISGDCERIPASPSFSVPHIGWNSLVLPPSLHASVEQLGPPSGVSLSDFYFVHSYVARPLSADAVIASFQHPNGLLAAAVASVNVIGFQFHPEKSGAAGYALLDHVLGR